MRADLGSMRRFYGVAFGAAAGAAAGLADLHARTVDIGFFAQRGDVLLSSAWSSTFSDPSLQAGPLQVGVLALVEKTGAGLAVPVEAGLAALLAYVCGRLLESRPARLRFAAQAAVVVVAIATGMLHRTYTDGHPAQVAIPLVWALAALEARRGRTALAGALVGLSAGLETWGALGLPLLLAGRGRAVGAFAACGALLYGPFLLFGDFRMFQYAWPVVAGSPANLWLAAGAPFTWWLRLVQAAAAIGAGGLLALRLRATAAAAAAAWAVPLTVVLVRLAFEPTLNDWYLIAVQTAALLAAADVFSGRVPGSSRAFGRPIGTV